MKITDKYVFFWASVLGNWTRVKGGIEIPGENFKLPTSEHVFMYLKAKFFGDQETAEAIVNTGDPKVAKKLGRLVRGFSEDQWIGYREKAMMTALELRFKSDEKFRDYLMDPKFTGLKFVEANPYDMIWSCGYLETDPRCELPKETWPGLNLLGKLLTELRDKNKKDRH